MKFDPEVVQMCSKLSGLAASYSTKEKFDSMLHFLSKRFDISFLFPKKWLILRVILNSICNSCDVFNSGSTSKPELVSKKDQSLM